MRKGAKMSDENNILGHPVLRVVGGDVPPLQEGEDRDFSRFEPSLAERRSAAVASGGDATKLRPRDALIQALRDIDSGVLNPEQVLVAYYETDPDDGTFDTGYFSAGPHVATFMVGMLERVKILLLSGG
jgi:hypothetical protein